MDHLRALFVIICLIILKPKLQASSISKKTVFWEYAVVSKGLFDFTQITQFPFDDTGNSSELGFVEYGKELKL